MRIFLLLIILFGGSISVFLTAANVLLFKRTQDVVSMKGSFDVGSVQGGRIEARVQRVIPPEAYEAARAQGGGSDGGANGSGQSFDAARAPEVQAEDFRQFAANEAPKNSTDPVFFSRPAVIDGGRLQSKGVAIELDGFIKLDLNETCQTERGEAWPCGRRAAAALKKLIGSRTLQCDPINPKRLVASKTYNGYCRLPPGLDISRWLLENGWARQLGDLHAQEVEAAKQKKLGIWAQQLIE